MREVSVRGILCWIALACMLASGSPWAQADDPPTTAPVAIPSTESLETAIRRGADFLLADQNKDGSWGTAQNTKNLNIFAPVPGAHHAFRAGTTALCVAGLIDSGLAEKDPKVKVALERGEAWLLEKLPDLRRADTVAIYNVWGHAYGIEALARMHVRETRDAERRKRIEDVIRTQYDRLRRYESVDGGWGYYDFKAGTQRPATDSTSFVTAAALVAFKAAQDIGVPPPEDVLKRAIHSINRQRKSDHSYLYGEYLKWRPMREINRAGGSLGRSQACNVALRLWGDGTVTDRVIADWLQKLVDRNGWLSVGRKRPVPHESWFQVAGYFFYFGHYYASLAADLLPAEPAAKFKGELTAIMLPLQEKDGSWWDYPLYNYHRQYGTGYALMTLSRCRAVRPTTP